MIARETLKTRLPVLFDTCENPSTTPEIELILNCENVAPAGKNAPPIISHDPGDNDNEKRLPGDAALIDVPSSFPPNWVEVVGAAPNDYAILVYVIFPPAPLGVTPL